MQRGRTGRLTPERAADLGVIAALLYALLICRFEPPLNAAHLFTAACVGVGLWLAFRWLARRNAASE